MKTLVYLFLALLFCSGGVRAQNRGIDSYLSLKPIEIQSGDTVPQQYDVTLKWQILDPLNGNNISCTGVHATYLFGMENNTVGWKDVRIAQIKDLNQEVWGGTVLPAFDSFSYQPMDTGFLKEAFYQDIPPDQRDLAKWLVSDAAQMHGLAWYVFDSLEYQQEFMPKLLENFDIRFEDWVTFTSLYQKLVWSGITKYNNEICAVVKFESRFNPVRIDNSQMSVTGRALYYGEMWISLEDKQVEHATMLEDNVLKIRNSSLPGEQFIDLQREIVFDKITEPSI